MIAVGQIFAGFSQEQVQGIEAFCFWILVASASSYFSLDSDDANQPGYSVWFGHSVILLMDCYTTIDMIPRWN